MSFLMSFLPLRHNQVNRGRRTATNAVAIAMTAMCAVGVLSSCGSSSPKSSADTPAGSDYALVPDAEVTAGLTKISATIATLEQRRKDDEADARAGLEDMYNLWFEFEGTIRKKEKEMYLQMEDGLVSIKIGVQENRLPKIASGVTDFETARAAYATKHP